jgi:hypothetical protein
MAERTLERALEGVADREPVDWEAVEREAGTNVDRDWVRWLKVLNGVADLHAAIDPEQSQPELPETQTPAPRAAQPSPAPRWGKYTLLQMVGEGGFGSVYRALDEDLELEVAIKILHSRFADAGLKQALLQEGRALARIRHENVVRVLGIESHDDQIALRMEFVRGETLDDVIERHGTLNAREAALVGEDVCRALAAVHLAGFVHRDVKARNVMREQAGRIVLMDFGAGRQIEELKLPGRIANVGTPLYMAPEVIGGAPATVASDVYSVGVLLYNLVTGQYPVDGKSLEEIRLAHMQGRRTMLAERRPDVPTGFVEVVERTLSPDPARRYASAAAVLQALQGIVLETDLKQSIRKWATIAVLGVIGVWLLGMLMSVHYNMNLGRAGAFVTDSPLTWLREGLSSLVTPALYMSGMVLIVGTLTYSMKVVLRIPVVGPILSRVNGPVQTVKAHLKLDEPEGFAQAVTLCGLLAMGGIIWSFADVLRASAPFTISNAPAALLLPLRVDETRIHPALYRFALEMLALFFVTALVRIRELRARQPSHSRGRMAPVIVLLALTVLAGEIPYRLMFRNAAERVSLGGERCYVLGTAMGDALLYCPDREPPRNQIIRLDHASLLKTGIVESIFEPPSVPER